MSTVASQYRDLRACLEEARRRCASEISVQFQTLLSQLFPKGYPAIALGNIAEALADDANPVSHDREGIHNLQRECQELTERLGSDFFFRPSDLEEMVRRQLSL